MKYFKKSCICCKNCLSVVLPFKIAELYTETECAQLVVNNDSYFLLTSVVSSQKHSVNLKALSHLFEESGNK
jgi:hypothetical protein